ncbi:TetR family transcriptional regulator [Mycolicibacterium novocastrense]|uniref:TetR/AcrR family transcriptional regulator n=1 Tax=Mycolicibacterium novocastrense TaxID=59813 RepID=UPI000747483B|nr:TetR/AcrR family transcriptional regulator [Mycolicibacterium novocastrense]KUH67527.1 TetR family transcriptional regulator [Mycolicibacterium novocastrense]KUH71400.1 TetR family transcriptional regulator [Mycolicibacterium novocastrense]KUH73287.1 TetR family transcriptional regulator [Mycolicibacterium novocastrense]
MPRRRDGSGLSVDVDEAREQILAAAEAVILRYGIPKTTMDDIGKEAGVSRPTVYRYFGDRDALIGALIERRSRMLFGRARKFILSHETFADQLVEGLVYLVDHGRKDPIVRILVSPEHMGMTSPIVGESNLAAGLTAEMWEPIFQRAIDRGEIRSDIDLSAVAEWLALVQFIMVGRLDFSPSEDPDHREMLRAFVLPAFCPVDDRVGS